MTLQQQQALGKGGPHLKMRSTVVDLEYPRSSHPYSSVQCAATTQETTEGYTHHDLR